MKPELQKIAIAKACGWKHDTRDLRIAGIPIEDSFPWISPDGERAYPQQIPDYLNSLDAMHDAEKIKEMQFNSEYSYWIAHIAVRDRGLNEDSTELADGYQMAITSTAAQRCEAFLRTLNLWQS